MKFKKTMNHDNEKLVTVSQNNAYLATDPRQGGQLVPERGEGGDTDPPQTPRPQLGPGTPLPPSVLGHACVT